MEQRYIEQEQEAERHLEAAKKLRQHAEAAASEAHTEMLRGHWVGADGWAQQAAEYRKRALAEEEAADEAEAWAQRKKGQKK